MTDIGSLSATRQQRFHDFDAAWTAADKGPLIIHLFGQDWELPGGMPAEAATTVANLDSVGRSAKDLSAGEAMGFATSLIPPATLQAWFDKGIGVHQLLEVVGWLVREWTA